MKDQVGLNRFPAVVLIGLLFLGPIPLHAEPSLKINYLMKDCVSMLDFGLFRLQLELETQLKSSAEPIFSPLVSYDYQRNRIQINGIILSTAANAQEANSWCRLFVQRVREILGVNRLTAQKLLGTGQGSFLSAYFQHNGYQSADVPTELAKELDTITEITATYSFSGGGSTSLRCQAPLLGTEITFSE